MRSTAWLTSEHLYIKPTVYNKTYENICLLGKLKKCTTCIGEDHVHTACFAQRNQDLLVRPYLSELSTLPFSNISSFSNILALG